jgi:mannose-6-phosphate isomerase
MGVNLIGSRNKWALKQNKFPLLVKIIDANKRLSLQVHPYDSYAAQNEKSDLGKSEMWVVLNADPGTGIIFGLSKHATRLELQDAISNGCLEDYIKRIEIHSGDHICVPPGTLHAILEGSLIVEIQQSSNTTYRLYDWNRLNSSGTPRELHLEKALDVLNYNQVNVELPEPIEVSQQPGFKSEILCHNPYFTTERITIQSGVELTGNCDGDTFEIWGVLQGEIEVNHVPLTSVNFSLLPAAMGLYKIKAYKDSVLLKSFVK